MHGLLVAFLGLVALGGVQPRALLANDLALGQRSTELDYTHLSDYPLDDPRNDGLAQRSPAVAGDLLGGSDASKLALAVRIAARAAPPPRPKPVTPNRPGLGRPGNRPRPGRPNAKEEPDNAFMAIERAALSDTSDIVRTSPCGAAKRSLKDAALGSSLRGRMSGDEKVYTLAEWKKCRFSSLPSRASANLVLVLEEVDMYMGQIVEEERIRVKGKMKVIWMGGLAGLTIDSRGPDGKTGDADISVVDNQDANIVKVFWKAVDRLVVKNPGKFEVIESTGKPDPINAMWDEHVEPKVRNTLTDKSQEIAWEGNYQTHFIGDWRMQLMGKMTRIAEWRSRSTEYKAKDQQDAKAFLQKVKELSLYSGKDLGTKDFVEWGAMLGQETDVAASYARVAMKIVTGDEMPGITQELRDAVNKIIC
jgi:hypothetical protein